jgi:hypothetical protein
MRQLKFALCASLLIGAGSVAHAQRGCNAASVRGRYAVQVSGWVQIPGQTSFVPFAEGGTLEVNADGTFEGVSILNIGGQTPFPTHTFTGRAEVNADCTAVAQILTSNFLPSQLVNSGLARGFWVIVKPNKLIQQTGMVPGGTTTGTATVMGRNDD